MLHLHACNAAVHHAAVWAIGPGGSGRPVGPEHTAGWPVGVDEKPQACTAESFVATAGHPDTF